jgi:hypothetical protein
MTLGSSSTPAPAPGPGTPGAVGQPRSRITIQLVAPPSMALPASPPATSHSAATTNPTLLIPLAIPYFDVITHVRKGYFTLRRALGYAIVMVSLGGLELWLRVQRDSSRLAQDLLEVLFYMVVGWAIFFVVAQAIDAMGRDQTKRDKVERCVQFLEAAGYDPPTIDDIEHMVDAERPGLVTSLGLPTGLLAGLVGILALQDILVYNALLAWVLFLGAILVLFGFVIIARQEHACLVVKQAIVIWRRRHGSGYVSSQTP